MLPLKLDLSEDLAGALRQLRLSNPVNGKILTAENMSKTLGKNRAWISQVESRRLKKIKREDIINIYKLLFNLDDTMAEYVAERDLEQYYLNNDDRIPFFNPNFEKELNPDFDTEIEESYSDEDATEEMYELTMKTLLVTIDDIYRDMKSGKEKMDLFNFIRLLDFNIFTNYSDTVSIYSNLNLELLKYANDDERTEIFNSFDNIKNKLDALKERQLISSLKDRLNHLNTTHLPISSVKNTLLFGLVELSQLVSYETIDNQQKIDCINDYIETVKKYYPKYYAKVPFTIQKLDESCDISDMQTTITYLQLLLNDADSPVTFRGKVTDYDKDLW